MKILIGDAGFLSIERAGKMRQQTCPMLVDAWCGDWCPMFGEPTLSDNPETCGSLDLCRTILYGDITDERVKHEE